MEEGEAVTSEPGTTVNTQPDATDERPSPETLEVIYDHLKEVPEVQQADARDLDTKMVQILQAASVVIALAGFATGNLAKVGMPVSIMLIGALLCYVGVAVLVFSSLAPRQFRRSLQGDALWAYYWNKKPEEVRHALVHDVSKAYLHNRGVLKRKARYLRAAIVVTGVEVALVGAALILSRWA
jgi:hypothetical protein